MTIMRIDVCSAQIRPIPQNGIVWPQQQVHSDNFIAAVDKLSSISSTSHLKHSKQVN